MNQNVSSSLSIEYEEIRPSRKEVLVLVPGMNQKVSSSFSIEYEDIKPSNNAAYNQSDSSLIEIIWERPANKKPDSSSSMSVEIEDVRPVRGDQENYFMMT
jgi:hypothetical protein